MTNTLIESGKNIAKKGVSSRESRLFYTNIFLMMIVFVLSLVLSAVFFLEILRPTNTVVVDSKTGQILGDYRTKAYRTDDEIKAATKRFVGCEMSYDSRNIYEDFACALLMMSEEQQEKRLNFLKKENLTKKIAEGNLNSRISSIETKILERKGQLVRVSTYGVIMLNSNVPIKFRQNLTWKQVAVSEFNTSGVILVERKEYEI
jgi:hypothetical protein